MMEPEAELDLLRDLIRSVGGDLVRSNHNPTLWLWKDGRGQSHAVLTEVEADVVREVLRGNDHG